MSFDVLYIEDDDRDVEGLQNAVQAHNESNRRRLSLTVIQHPDELLKSLDEHAYNLILADLHFKDRENKLQFELSNILHIVSDWSKRRGGLKAPPVIAYTSREKVDLDRVLESKATLFDIWDKNSASPQYVVWRLSQIIVDISRGRPDALLEREIRTSMFDTPFHDQVCQMAREYSVAWTETDQIQRVGHVINTIGVRLGCHKYTESAWRLMEQWEPLGRALFHHSRGHARHVVNVFWLGYWILNQPGLRVIFERSWSKLLLNRAEMEAAKNTRPLDALNESWFYAALFHDIANCVQEATHSSDQLADILHNFSGILKTTKGEIVPEFAEAGNRAVASLGVSSRFLTSLWTRSVESNQPDHGVIAALFLQRKVYSGIHGCCAREAERAMMFHNLVAKVPEDTPALLSWDDEPIGCLLLLCDQIQTWDRERGDLSLLDKEGPIRAELSELDFSEGKEGLQLTLGIDYIAPPHLDQDSAGFGRVKAELEKVLRTRVLTALQLIQRPWPFATKINFQLSGEPLAFPIEFSQSP